VEQYILVHGNKVKDVEVVKKLDKTVAMKENT